MSISTYAELQTSVQNWLHRGDLAAIVPDLIMLAESRINGDLDARLQDSVANLSCVANQATVPLPTDIINMRHISVETDPIRTLKYVAPDQYNILYPSNSAGMPEIYTVIATDIYLNPIPDSAYTMQAIYKAKVPALSVASPTNWLITNYPHVYLYGALCEAAPYLKDDNRLQVWDAKYRESVDSVNAQDWYSGSTMTVRTDVRA